MNIPGEAPECAVTIADLTAMAKDVLEGAFPRLWIKGEVSNFTAHRSGHWYFTLKDESAQLSCTAWKQVAARIPAAPDEGMQVMARGKLTVYPARGTMQFSVDALQAEGDGLWQKAFDETRARLDKDGLLDPSRKRRLPRVPRTVAIITSPDGAALRDIIAVSRRRHPGVELVIIPAAVQGEGAPDSLVAALDRLERWGGADVLIIGRGGGSREDLWAFNDERVVRAIAAVRIPTISAVGHETDITLADLVADLRAPTPSAAAEAAVPELKELQASVRVAARRMATGLGHRVTMAQRELRRAAETLRQRTARGLERRRARMEQVAGRLQALSPLGILARGYGVARTASGHPLTQTRAFSVGGAFVLQLQDGRVDAHVDAVHPEAASAAGRME